MKRLFAVFLVLSLVFTLSACGDTSVTEDIPTGASDSFISGALQAETEEQTPAQTAAASTENKPAKEQDDVKTPTLEERFTATWTVDAEQQPGQQFSNDAGTSIDVLREEIYRAGALFGVAYVGYYEYIEETGIDFAQWYEAAASPLAADYPFCSEIDMSHTIGESGYLYCIIGKNYEDTITVTDQNGQMLYSASNGDPILLFCDRGGDGRRGDLIVTITAADGTACTYVPRLDELSYPQLLIGDERQLLSWDFTPTQDDGFDLESWLVDGWGGVTAAGLAYDESGTSWWIDTWDGSVSYCLSFYLVESGNYDGEVTLECFYKDDPTLQAEWEGWWSIETELEQPSRLTLDVALFNGADKAAFQDASVVTESYLTMIPPSGEYLLLVADDKNAELPIFPEGTQAVELTLAMG